MLALDQARVQIGGVDRALRDRRRHIRPRNRVRAEPAAATINTPRAITLVGLLGAHLVAELLFHALLGFRDALRPITRDRLRVLGALIIQPTPRLPKPLPAASAG